MAGTEDAVLMVEAGAKEVSEETMLEAIAFGHEQCQQLARIQKDLVAQAGKPRWAFDPNAGKDLALAARVREIASGKLAAALATHEKHARAEAVAPRVRRGVDRPGSSTDEQEGRGAGRVRGGGEAPRCAG